MQYGLKYLVFMVLCFNYGDLLSSAPARQTLMTQHKESTRALVDQEEGPTVTTIDEIAQDDEIVQDEYFWALYGHYRQQPWWDRLFSPEERVLMDKYALDEKDDYISRLAHNWAQTKPFSNDHLMRHYYYLTDLRTAHRRSPKAVVQETIMDLYNQARAFRITGQDSENNAVPLSFWWTPIIERFKHSGLLIYTWSPKDVEELRQALVLRNEFIARFQNAPDNRKQDVMPVSQPRMHPDTTAILKRGISVQPHNFELQQPPVILGPKKSQRNPLGSRLNPGSGHEVQPAHRANNSRPRSDRKFNVSPSGLGATKEECFADLIKDLPGAATSCN